MKNLANGQSNELSFVKAPLMQDIPFTITITKAVGGDVYVFDNLYDKFTFDIAKDFVVFDVDLTDFDVKGGEYVLELSDDFRSYGKYVCLVDDYTFDNSTNTNELFTTTVKISNL